MENRLLGKRPWTELMFFNQILAYRNDVCVYFTYAEHLKIFLNDVP